MNKTNKNITFQGNPLRVEGTELNIGDRAPQFQLTAQDLSDATNDTYRGKILVLCVVPSLDTPTCSIEMKRFNQEASEFGDRVQIIAISEDLPFAQKRWCGAEGVTRVTTLSDYKHRQFGKAYGVWLPDTGLLTRAVFVVDTQGVVQHVEYVKVLSDEPDYGSALQKVRELL